MSPRRPAKVSGASARSGGARARSCAQLASVLAAYAIGFWVWWWAGSFGDFRLQFAGVSWLNIWPMLGLDFMHNYLGARAWLEGTNPYTQSFGDPRGFFAYPPVVLRLFAWTRWVPQLEVAAALWAAFIALVCLGCVQRIAAFRDAQGMNPLPTIVMAALVLLSAPVVFAMERGNCDVLVLIGLLFAAAALGHADRRTGDLLAAIPLALAVTIKIYPLLVIAALLALRRARAVAAMLAGVFFIGIVSGPAVLDWLHALRATQIDRISPVLALVDWMTGVALPDLPANLSARLTASVALWGSLHSPGDWWPALCLRFGFASAAAWPLLAVHLVVLTPVTVWGCWKIFRSANSERLILPILLWIMAVAVFWMPFSFDYNLIYLPLVMLALWDRRDPCWIHLLLLPSILWWVPFGPIGYDWALARVLLKLLALHLATAMLVRRLEGGASSCGRRPATRRSNP